jgi:hypothetical protein
MYTVKIFEEEGILNAPSVVIFKDCSNDFNPPSNRKRNGPISLPNPDYIKIHAAIADILNVSGAGIFFDELLNTRMMKARFPLCDRGVSSKS